LFVCLLYLSDLNSLEAPPKMPPRGCEFDVAEEPNTVPVTLRKKVDKKTKRPVEELLEEVPSVDSNYQPISIPPQIIAEHINSNAIKIQTEEKKNTENLTFSHLWHLINKYEIETFIDILLYMSVYRCSEYENYWNISSVRFFYIEIQNAMSCNRFEQILRYWKISDSDEILDFKDSDFWKKLESLTTDIQASSQWYWKLSRNVFVDEQLIDFWDRSKHFMQLSTKIINKSFKIYSLCDENYMLNFLFIFENTFYLLFFTYKFVENFNFQLSKWLEDDSWDTLRNSQENYLKKILKKNSVV